MLLLVVVLLALHHFTYPRGSHRLDQIWDAICVAVSMFGLAVRFYAVGYAPERTSGRNTRGQVAELLNTTGLYSVMRHPLYFGNFWIWFGVSLFPRVWWVPLVVTLGFMVFYERVMFAEEQFLRERFGRSFIEWAAKTPAFFPRISQWQPSQAPFSLRKALKGEYSGFFGIIAIFTALEVLGTAIVEHRFFVDPEWAVLFSIGLAVYMVLRCMKHRKLLNRPSHSSR